MVTCVLLLKKNYYCRTYIKNKLQDRDVVRIENKNVHEKREINKYNIKL